HVAAGREAQLREVAVHGTAVPRLQHVRVAVDEDDRAEPVQLGLVAPALAVGQLVHGPGELGFDRWLQRKCHDGTLAYEGSRASTLTYGRHRPHGSPPPGGYRTPPPRQ